MARTITNFADFTDPITESIDAQTEFMEGESAAYGEYLNTIANTPLDCASGPTAADLQDQTEPCCLTETLVDTPGPGDTTERETCSNGKVTDTVTYADGQTCTFEVSGAAAQGEVVTADENCQPLLVDAVSECKPRTPGQPYDEYFLPVLSDFGNQVYCVPDATYAFAWTGVLNADLKDFLETNSAEIDLEDPNNKYVAVVNGGPYQCPGPMGIEMGLDGEGNPYYCFADSFGFAFAHNTPDPDEVVENPGDPGTISFDNMGDRIACPAGSVDPSGLHPLQLSQSNRLGGCYSPILTICPAWDGVVSAGAGGDTPPDTPPDFANLDCGAPDINGKTAQSAYYALWHDWWCCEKRSKQLQQWIYAAQVPLALAGLITSIRTYNDILDKNLELLCNVVDDADLLTQCSAALLGTPEEPGILKQCEANLLEGHNDRIGTINDRGAHACQVASDEFDCYTQLWKPLQTRHAEHMASRLHTMLDNGQITSDYTQSWANGLQECVTENLLPELKRQFAPLLSSVNCTSNNLNEWREDLKRDAHELQDHFNRVYKTGEETMIPVMMDMSACLVQRVCELRDWLYDCARCDQAVYKEGYQQGEVPQARAAMAASAHLIPKVVESVDWLDKNLPAIMHIFEVCHADEQKTLNPLLYGNARELAKEVQNCFEFFKDNACEYKGFWENCYKDKECRLVCTQVEMACRLAEFAEESLRRLDRWNQIDREMFDCEFRQQEIDSTKRVARHGWRASEELHEFGHWFDERTKEFHDTYHCFWLPADIHNLKRHEAVWDRGDPLQGIERNNEDMDKMSKDLQEFVEHGILHAETYMDEVFKDADLFEYCVEEPAVLHVRKRIDTALQELECCTPRYCTGHFADARVQLKAQGARAEGSAYESATRWKWWANEQMKDKNADRKADLLKIMDAYAIRAIEANKTETAGYDLLLNHMSGAITRGQLYLEHMQRAGQLTATIKTSEVDALLRVVQLWHFWPELAQQGQVAFQQGVAQVHQDAARLLDMGHFWPSQVNQEKTSAVGVINQSIDVGMRLTQLSQFYLQQADNMNAGRAQISNAAGQLGNAYAQTGHRLHGMAADKVQGALNSSIQGAQIGLGAADVGQRHMATALEIENRMTLNALEHLKAGISAYRVGIDMLGEVRSSYQLSGSFAGNAGQQMLSLFNEGRQQGLFGIQANEQCIKTQYEMLCKAKEFLQRNFQITQSSLHGGTSGTLGALSDLLQQQGANAGSAFSLLGNSLQGLTQNTTPMPFPSGGATFGTSAPGGFGGTGFAG